MNVPMKLLSSIKEFELIDLLGFLADSIFNLLEVYGVLGIVIEVFDMPPAVVFSLPDDILLLPL